MAALSKKLRSAEGGLVHFWCPGCNQVHCVRVSGKNPRNWDGNMEYPTFSPSILVSYYQMASEGRVMIKRGVAPPDGHRYPGKDMICHSFITAGQIQFLNDCTHELAGKTVDLPDWTELRT